MKKTTSLLSFLLFAASAQLHAANLIWDNDNVTSGAQDGIGTWSVGGTTFWDGAANVATTNDITTDIATFGVGGVGAAVTANAQSINGLIFDTTVTSGYTLSGGILTIGNSGITATSNALATSVGNAIVMGSSLSITNNSAGLLTLGSTVTSAATGTQTLTVAGSGNTTINGLVNDGTSGTLNITKTGAGYLKLGGAATNIAGALDIQGGTVGVVNDFTATGLTGTGTFENASNNDKWTFWNIGTNQTFDGVIRNNNGTNTGLLGFNKNGTGTLTLTNNANNATSVLNVNNGRLILNNTGTYGSTTQSGAVRIETAHVGNTAAANGVLEINGATVNYNNRSASGGEVYRSTLNVGSNGTGAGALKLTSGSLSTNRQLALGATNGAYGAMTQTGGTTNVGGFLAVALGGANARGVLNVSGGNFNQAGPVTLGAAGIGVINLSGSAIYNQTSTGDNGLWVGEGGTGMLNVSGSASLSIVSGNNGLQLGRGATGVGTVNLLGGTVTVKAVSKGAGAGTLNFNGGTLAANIANTSFLTGLTNAYVNAGGGTINNDGNAITIGQALLAPTGNGVNATGLTVSGGGYIDTPIVTITGGGGSGATAIATINGSGNLTGITITNPGIGYTSTPTFALSGGGIGNTGALGGSATLAANTSGGMTFSGGSITTLTGASTYTGATMVSAGTLLVNGSLGNTAVTVASGAKLGGTGGTIGSGSASVAVAAGGTLAPGASAGALTVNGSVTIDGVFAYEYDGGTLSGDVLDVNGNLTLNSATLTLADLAGDTWTNGDKFTLAAYDALSGTFSGYVDDTSYTFGGGQWLFNYDDTTAGANGGSGINYITITAIPEPAAALLGGLGMIVLLRRRRN